MKDVVNAAMMLQIMNMDSINLAMKCFDNYGSVSLNLSSKVVEIFV